MNSQRDCEEFIRKFSDLSRETSTNIMFSVYKSKVDRITQNTAFKKYNNFNKGEDFNTYQQGMYRSYNDLIQGNPQAGKIFINGLVEFGNNLNAMMGADPRKPGYKSYNTFDEVPAQTSYNAATPKYNQYNNFNNQAPNNNYPAQTGFNNVSASSRINVDAMSEEDVAEFIYAYVEPLYPRLFFFNLVKLLKLRE